MSVLACSNAAMVSCTDDVAGLTIALVASATTSAAPTVTAVAPNFRPKPGKRIRLAWGCSTGTSGIISGVAATMAAGVSMIIIGGTIGAGSRSLIFGSSISALATRPPRSKAAITPPSPMARIPPTISSAGVSMVMVNSCRRVGLKYPNKAKATPIANKIMPSTVMSFDMVPLRPNLWVSSRLSRFTQCFG